MKLFDNDIRGMMWGTSHVINGLDANGGGISIFFNGDPTYFIGEDWLPYQNNPAYNDPNWCHKMDNGEYDGQGGCERVWRHSRRGDWRKEYWDKTANQAFHSWFYTSSRFFDLAIMPYLGNNYHDPMSQWVKYDFISSPEDDSPPYSGISKPDDALSLKAIELGVRLREQYALINILYPPYCRSSDLPVPPFDPGVWIRANYKQ